MDLKNKIAVVTGGSSGMGKEITEALVKGGCKVVFTFNSKKKEAEEIADKLGSKSFPFKVDLHKDEDIDKLFDFVKEKFGKMDILVNNAGQNRPREMFDLATWREIFQVNLFSSVHCTEKAIGLMKDSGKILNITSIFGEDKACWKGLSAYGASKPALNNFTRSLAKNFAPKILVNAIAPGYVKTPLWINTTDEDFESAGNEQLIERMINPKEIADMAIAIIKNDAMTGEVVVVDGGLSLKTV